MSTTSLFNLGLVLRKRIYDLFFNAHIKDNYYHQFEHFITYMIVLNMAGLVLEHIPVIYESRQHLFHLFDVFSLGVFTVEYALRLYVAPEDPAFRNKKIPRLAFIKSPFALIDLVSILPFYLGAFFDADLRVLRVLRLLRLFKLFRAVTPAIHDFLEQNKNKTFRYKIAKNKLIDNASQEQDMGIDPENELIAAADWAFKKYPAKKHALILWNHGSSLLVANS